MRKTARSLKRVANSLRTLATESRDHNGPSLANKPPTFTQKPRAVGPSPTSSSPQVGGSGRDGTSPTVWIAAGLAAAAALAYTTLQSGDKTETKKHSHYETVIEGSEPITPPPDATAATNAQPPPPQSQQNEAEQPTTTAAAAEAVPESTKQEEQPTIVDSDKVLAMIQDVFTKDATALLNDNEKIVGSSSSSSSSSPTNNKQADSSSTSSTSPVTSSTGTLTKQQQQAHSASTSIQEVDGAQAAVALGIADQAGEAVTSSIIQAPAVGTTPLQPSSAPMGTNSSSQGILPATVIATSPAGLLAASLNRHGGMKDSDWAAYPHYHKQATEDAQTLAEIVSTAAGTFNAQVEAARQEAEAAKHTTEQIKHAAAAQAQQFQHTLRTALKAAEHKHKQDLKLHAEQLTLAHAEVTVTERTERLQALDTVRMKLDALEVALSRRAAESKAGHRVHEMSIGVFGLLEALQSGDNVKEAVEYLKGVCKDDALVQSVLDSTFTTTTGTGSKVPTRAELNDEYENGVENAVKELSMIPVGQGGFLSVTAAKFASKLKLREHQPQAGNIPGESIDKSLAAVRQALTTGELLEAASGLESATAGTAAAPAVRDWVRQVKRRAKAEQAAMVLEARAATLTASLA